jgi:hypothetical protein
MRLSARCPAGAAVEEAAMLTGPSIRDLLDSMARAVPAAEPARDRVRDETLALLVALFGPAQGDPDPALKARIIRAADAIMEERATRLPHRPDDAPRGGAAAAGQHPG